MNKMLAIIIMILLSENAFSVGAIVHDPLAWIESKITAAEQVLTKKQMMIANSKHAVMIKKQLDLIERAKDRHSQLENLKSSLSGKNAYGKFLWGPFEMLDPSQTPDSFEELYWMTRDIGKNPEVLEKGYGKGARDYMDRKKYIEPRLSNYPDSPIYKDMERQKINSVILGVNSETTYKESGRNYRNINSFQHEIDQTNDVKAALDLNNRILTEIALIQTQMLRLYSVETQVTAEKEHRDYNKKANSRIRHSVDVGW